MSFWKNLWSWLPILLSGKPHFYVGGQEQPYLLRWYLLPRNPLINLYLHKFVRDDEDRAEHNHPWICLSLMIRGGYIEHSCGTKTYRYAPSIAFRWSSHVHRVELHEDFETGEKRPCWTIVLTGPKVRTWGFFCPKGFVPWFDFVDQRDHGNIGRGCE